MSDLSHRVNDLFAREQWSQARTLLLAALERDPDSHWLLTRIGTCYYEERDYTTALDYEQRAHALAPECPLVAWDLACTLAMLDRINEALTLYDWIVGRGAEALAFGDCGEGLVWAEQLVADARKRVEELR